MKIKMAIAAFILSFFIHLNGFCQLQLPNIPTIKLGVGQLSNSTLVNNQHVFTAFGIPNAANLYSSSPISSGSGNKPLAVLNDVDNIYDPKFIEASPFFEAFSALNKMTIVDSKFSITEAVYLVENAYYNKQYPRSNYYSSIAARTNLCKQILKREHLGNDNLSLNYVIQQLYRQDNEYIDPKTGNKTTIPRLVYDFNDFLGDSSYSQMFVSKIFASGKGQCHSLPLLYLILAEQLGAKAYLSIAPEHAFIRFPDTAGRLYNFETTSGVLTTDKFLMQSGFINVTAIKNKIYLDTLSKQQFLATCLADLAQEYISIYGYDNFVESIISRILQLYPNSIQANMMLANMLTAKALKAIKQSGCPGPEDLSKYPSAYALHTDMLKQYSVIDGLGYMPMPQDAYQNWLKEVESQKNKQAEQQAQKQLNYQLQHTTIKKITTNNK